MTNELTWSMAGNSGGVATAVVVELRCTMDSPSTMWSPLAPVERVKSSGHIAADKPGSYHGQDSSLC